MKKISIYGLLLPFTDKFDFYLCLGCGGKVPRITSSYIDKPGLSYEEKLFSALKNHWLLCPKRLPIQPDLGE